MTMTDGRQAFLDSCTAILQAISSGKLVDTYVDGEYHLDAWEAFDTTWRRSDNDAKQALLTPYQRNIFGEFWFVLENSDANPETVEPYEADWSTVQSTATKLLAMLSDKQADQNSRPFVNWFSAPSNDRSV